MQKQPTLGAVQHSGSDRKTDYLYRISIKGLIRNEAGEVLVVKEAGRGWWDLPGGGMHHGEDIKSAIARELEEEVSLSGNFDYKIIAVDEPVYLQPHNFWQVRLIFELRPIDMSFSAGEDADEIAFMNPVSFMNSQSEVERRIYRYIKLAA